MAEMELKAALKLEVEEEKARILSQAKREGDDILAACRREIELLRSRYIEELEKGLQQEKQRLLAESELSAKKEISCAKEEIFKLVMTRIKAGLEDISKDKERYRQALRSLIEEAKEDFSEEPNLKVKARPSDLELLKKLLSESKIACRIEEDASLSGGIIISDSDERRIFYNTFDSRLEKIAPEIRRRLYGLM